jgi:hypothetical protein
MSRYHADPDFPPADTAAAALLDPAQLDAVDPQTFQQADPYPWLDIEGLLTAPAFAELRQALPATSQMQGSFGRKRAHGQQPHDRYALEYSAAAPVADVWHQLVDELEGPIYRKWLAGMLDTADFHLTYHWHYTPRGCSVSPHCDAKRKLGSHIFYFNTEEDWRPEWGGQTLVLDDGGRFKRSSAPDFDDFPRSWSAPCIGNRSLLFQRQGNSWHGVKPLDCPEDRLRKVFIVVVNADSLAGRIRRLFHKPEGY